ncbi:MULTISPECIES: hypothetical protein [Sphingomonas]|jgi:hypothetical protein|uniref:Uncharacterized protein n=1 Tax=Sphingomonas zeae TaxID=1646122 RepID=A0A7Y6B3H2_9SPHN|nr:MULTISPECIES: hypothetical protein [Sphingomonas]MBB4048347.1 hypothetical protein [Sphingomonas zeae]MDK8186233.1 hypothetical protein [Sphingomonas zeae]MDK8215755.1 hypothetical protein [Sphingomonas sp. UMB7805-LC452B]NUU46750.1 hypothetical protein [Sphingomonas zeae]
MAASLFLLLAVILAFAGGSGPWIMIATVAAATAAGTRLPDLDTPLHLQHRSALIHSVLPFYVAMLDLRTWPVAAGLGFGIGFHLAADLFPTTMRGFATIKMPLLGSIGVFASYLWIAVHAAANLVGALIVLERIAADRVAACALGVTAVLGAGYLLRAQGGLYALAAIAGLGWLFLR